MWVRDPEVGHVPYEYFVLRQLDHPAILRVFDHYEDGRYFVIVSELHGTSWCSDNPILQDLRLYPYLRSDRLGYHGPDDGDDERENVDPDSLIVDDPDQSLTHCMTRAQKAMVREKPRYDLFECMGKSQMDGKA